MFNLKDSTITQWFFEHSVKGWFPCGPCEAAAVLTGIDADGIEILDWIPWRISLGNPERQENESTDHGSDGRSSDRATKES